jgi:hypothetical protein
MQTTQPRDRATLGVMRQVFADQAVALDRIFTGTAIEAVSNSAGLCRDMRLALQAQALCLESCKILLALPDEGTATKKFRNRANELMEGQNNHHDQWLAE